MILRALSLVAIALIIPPQFVAQAQSKEETNMNKVRVRYMVNELDPAVNFIRHTSGFKWSRKRSPILRCSNAATWNW